MVHIHFITLHVTSGVYFEYCRYTVAMIFFSLPTFKLVGDNIDKAVQPREEVGHDHTRMLNYFHSYAVQDRLDMSKYQDLPSLPNLEDANVEDVLPTQADCKTIKKNFVTLTAKVIRCHMPYFKMQLGLIKPVSCKYAEEMSKVSHVVGDDLHYVNTECSPINIFQVPLGVLLKNEKKHSDMIDILECAHKYIPTQTTEETLKVPVEADGEENEEDDIVLKIDEFHYLLYGGDQLTVERMRGAKNIRSNLCRGKERLEGIQPVIEDWHAKVVLLKV